MSNYKLVPVEPTPEMLDAAVQDGICVDGKPVWKRDVVFQAKWKYQQMLAAASAINIVATKNEQGQIVSVTLQDEDHHILQVIAEADVQEESEPCQECGGDGAGGEHEEDCVMAQITPDVEALK